MFLHVTHNLLQIQIGTSEGKERQQGYYLKLASLQQQLGQTSDAAQHFQQLLHGPLALMDELQRLHVECQLADLQVIFCLSAACCSYT